MQAKQAKSGSVIEVNGAPHVVENVGKHTPTARGGATLYKIRARNMLTQHKVDLACKGDESFGEPNVETHEVQYMYADGPDCVFMDLETYDQYSLPDELVGEAKLYLVEDMEGIHVMILDGRVVGIRMPDVVVQELVECDPAIKGASATARTKPATTQTGLIVQVPEYMENHEVIRIDARTGKFLQRA
ncbi:MAG: elongation factor P [Lentisphaeria bacterium]|nr:elongation factor P [Lentisphaeria bacterium]